jgi:hypothetical protein
MAAEYPSSHKNVTVFRWDSRPVFNLWFSLQKVNVIACWQFGQSFTACGTLWFDRLIGGAEGMLCRLPEFLLIAT